MGALDYVQAVVSTAYRVVVYAFLQVAPASILRQLLVALYTLYLILWVTSPFYTTEQSPADVQAESNGETHSVDEKEEKEEKEEKVAPINPQTSIQPAGLFPTLVFSLRSPSHSLRLANLFINTLLLAAVAEFVLYPYFDDASDVIYTRVGAVSPFSAKIVIRYPGDNVIDHVVQVAWKQSITTEVIKDDAWSQGPVANLTQEKDWVATIKLDGLWPSTEYEYVLFDANQTLLSYPAKPIKFHTFPDPLLHGGSRFKFVASSCVTPNFPYKPLQGRRIKGFELLAESLWPTPVESSVKVETPEVSETSASSTPDKVVAADTLAEEVAHESSQLSEVPLSIPIVDTAIVSREPPETPTEFMIFMGDFIYADVPLYFGDDKEAYRRLYRRNYQSNGFRKVYERLPIFHVYDDHEIINNYAGQANDSNPPFLNANDAFTIYNADANPDPIVEGHHYYEFCHGDAAFFVMDTRRYRSAVPDTEEESRTMLGEQQLTALYDWLGRLNETATFKFIVTSVPFTSLWTYEAEVDCWNAYEREKAALLRAFHSVPNVILLSGDRHEFAAIEFLSEDPNQTIYEISTSPLNMFYVPFIRTLRAQSEATVSRTKEVERATENGTVVVTLETEELPKERVLRYIAEGNHKWSSIEVDTRDKGHPTVHVEIMIDGAKAYSLTIQGQPVNIKTTSALGVYVPQTLKGVLDKLGLNPNRWF